MELRMLRLVTRLALWIFFRNIRIKGRHSVPQDRPLIFVANHPNVMLDALLLGLSIPGPTPRFLAKSTLFRHPLFAWFLHHLGAIPVARPRDRGTKMSSNRDMLRSADRVLQEGHALVHRGRSNTP